MIRLVEFQLVVFFLLYLIRRSKVDDVVGNSTASDWLSSRNRKALLAAHYAPGSAYSLSDLVGVIPARLTQISSKATSVGYPFVHRINLANESKSSKVVA